MLKFLVVTLAGSRESPSISGTRDPRFLNATDNYSRANGEAIAKT